MSGTVNRVITWKQVGSVVKSGKEIILGVATETSDWTRPEAAVDAMKDGFIRSVDVDKRPLPAGTARVISRESDHQSLEDQRDHYTGVAQDEKGDHIETVHIPKN